MIKESTPAAFDRVSIRSVLRGTEAPKPRGSSRRNKALVGWLLYCAVALGGTAAAFSVRDTLFPSLGASTDNRVWPNPKAVDSTVTSEHGSSTIAEAATTAAAAAALVEATATPTVASVEPETVPTVSNPSQGPGNSIDSSGPGGGATPAPGTTVDDSSKGPGPGTTVAEHPTETSTPGSASTPPASADAPATSASTPADPVSSSVAQRTERQGQRTRWRRRWWRRRSEPADSVAERVRRDARWPTGRPACGR